MDDRSFGFGQEPFMGLFALFRWAQHQQQLISSGRPKQFAVAGNHFGFRQFDGLQFVAGALPDGSSEVNCGRTASWTIRCSELDFNQIAGEMRKDLSKD
jgi:hypothetical protein